MKLTTNLDGSILAEFKATNGVIRKRYEAGTDANEVKTDFIKHIKSICHD